MALICEREVEEFVERVRRFCSKPRQDPTPTAFGAQNSREKRERRLPPGGFLDPVEPRNHVGKIRTVARLRDNDARLDDMFLRAYGRLPDAKDRELVGEFLARQAARHPEGLAGEAGLWADLAHALFNVKEFIFLN